MLQFLFGRLTDAPNSGGALFESLTAVARRPGWYVEGQIPDSLDGRFAVLATVIALALNRADQLGEPGEALSVALTERFIDVMESEHREFGLGDPTLGKTVRSLVAALGRRVGLWRNAIGEPATWRTTAGSSLYRDDPETLALDWAERATRDLWQTLGALGHDALAKGKFE